jgi:hypothetical protein
MPPLLSQHVRCKNGIRIEKRFTHLIPAYDDLSEGEGQQKPAFSIRSFTMMAIVDNDIELVS